MKNNFLEKLQNDSNLLRDAEHMMKQSRERFEICERIAEQMPELDDRIRYWADEKAKYLRSLSLYDKGVSGHTGTRLANDGELFFDLLVSTELEALLTKKKLEPESNTMEDAVSDEIQQRIAWLHATGVIDYLRSSTGVTNATGLGKIVKPFTGGTVEANRKAIERITERNSAVFEKYSEWINAECKRLKISRLN